MIIVRSTQFKKDFKKIRNNQQTVNLFQEAVLLLFNGSNIPIVYKEHPLTGDQKGITDIHIKPDLLLLYRIDLKKDELHLIRIGSHSTLFD